MKHVFDVLDFITEPIIKLRKKYGLEGYAVYVIARHLMYLQKTKSLETELLIHTLRIHTRKSEEYIREFVKDCIKLEALQCVNIHGVETVYHIESILWYLLYCRKRKTVRVKVCEPNDDSKEQYVQIYEKFKDVIDADWLALYVEYNEEVMRTVNVEPKNWQKRRKKKREE